MDGRGTLRGWGHNSLNCCHFFRNRTMVSSSVHVWGFREAQTRHWFLETNVGPETSDPEDWAGHRGRDTRNDIRSAVKRGRET